MAKTPKSPRTPKSPKTPKSAKEKLDSIEKQFRKDLEEHERKAVLGFTREEVVRDLLTQQEKAKKDKTAKPTTPRGKKGKKGENEEKETKGKKGKSDKKGKKGDKEAKDAIEKPADNVKEIKEIEVPKPLDVNAFVLDERNFNQFYAKVKEYIDKSVKKSEKIAEYQKNKKEFDLLKYWEEKGDGASKQIDDKKSKGKESKDKKSKNEGGKDAKGKGTPRERGGAEKKEKGKGKGKGKETEENKEDKKNQKKSEKQDDSGCKLKGLSVIKLNEKSFSKLQPTTTQEFVFRPMVNLFFNFIFDCHLEQKRAR